MDRARFSALVAELDDVARRSPAKYRLRVVLLALLGYAYIFLAIAGIVAALAGIVYVIKGANEGFAIQMALRLGLPLVLIVYAVLRGLYVKFPVPDGLQVSRADAPKLFKMLDELASSLDAPRSDVVLATTDFNAGVVEVPRLGILGWPRHYLLLGLPLLSGLTPPQVRAVLAHELGHQSRRHGRIGGWIYRIRTTWTQILNRLRTSRRGSFLFSKFFEWYSPYFAAYSFVLARQQEYEADRHAAELTSAADLGEALINLDTKQRYLNSVLWPRIGTLVADREQPPEAIHTDMARAAAAPLPGTHAERYLTGAMTEDAGLADTHPALRERLAALGYAPERERRSAREASAEWNGLTELLGGNFAGRLLAVYDARWRASVDEKWKKAHADGLKQQQRVDELQVRIETGAATGGEAREHAYLVEELRGWEAATPYYATYLESNRGDLDVRFSYGRALLWQQNAAGIDQLEAASAKPALAVAAHQLVAAFLRDRGDSEGARREDKRAEAYAELIENANAERTGVTARDTLEPHGMPADVVSQIRQVLAGESAVKRAYAVRKSVEYLPEQSMHVIVVDAGYFFSTEAKRRALTKRLAAAIVLPDRGYVATASSKNRWLVRRAKNTKDSLIYSRPTRRS